MRSLVRWTETALCRPSQWTSAGGNQAQRPTLHDLHPWGQDGAVVARGDFTSHRNPVAMQDGCFRLVHHLTSNSMSMSSVLISSSSSARRCCFNHAWRGHLSQPQGGLATTPHVRGAHRARQSVVKGRF